MGKEKNEQIRQNRTLYWYGIFYIIKILSFTNSIDFLKTISLPWENLNLIPLFFARTIRNKTLIIKIFKIRHSFWNGRHDFQLKKQRVISFILIGQLWWFLVYLKKFAVKYPLFWNFCWKSSQSLMNIILDL